MKFKTPNIEHEYSLIPDKLREISELFIRLSLTHGVIPVVTRIKEPVSGESGVHQAWRAIDFRSQYFDGNVTRARYPQEVVDLICEEINKAYPRKDGKLTCIHHSFRGGPKHFHIQIRYSDLTKNEILRLYGNDNVD